MGGLRKTRGRAAILPTNLLSLQNLLKRDPPSYKEEFVQQLNHYKTTLQIFKQNPSNRSTEFTELIGFLAQVSSCFPEETADFPNDLAHLLSKHHNVLDIDLREKLVQNLVLLRNKSVISSISLLQTFFPILAVTNSKLLRAQIYESIVSTIKAENLKGKNMTLNKMIQSILFDMVQKDEASGVWAIRLTKELWSKNIWAGDARVAEICKNAALSLHTKVMLGGIYFFLGVDADDMEDDEDESNEIDLRRMQHQAGINKLSKNRAQRVKKAMVSDKKKRMSKKTPAILNFSALQILHDPQSFAEKLFSIHLASKRPLPFDHKLLLVTLLARLMGTHKLTLLSFYSFLQKWISPHQRDVTKILASLAGASHEFVPPEILSPVIKKIANEFVTTGVSPEVVCAGLNAIREICTRNPLCMDATLLQDLTEYKGSKDKGVMMASRSLITLYRDAAPEMLSKKDRGKTATMGLAAGTKESTQFGVERGVTRGIEGLELLEEFYAQKAAEKGLDPDDEGVDSDSDDGWAGFDVEDSDSDEGGTGWINVESDGEDLEFSDDSDDEDTKATKQVQKNATKTVKFADEEENDPKLVKGDGETAAKALEVSDASEKVDAEETNLRSIAMTRILTPADFKRLAELKAAVPGKKTHHSASAKRNAETGEFVNELDIEGPRKKAKQDLEARLASVAEGRKDREKFGSRKGQRSEEGRSTTNREKARKKNFLMVKHRKDIQGKSMKKLTIKRKELKAHIDRGRRGGKRGNK